MKAKISSIILVVFTLFTFLSCATIANIGAVLGEATGLINADTAAAISKAGVSIEKAFERITPEQEYYIGRAVGANVLSMYRLQTNMPAMTDYANKICNALIINSVRPEIFNGYHVGILDSDEINAFATPGGHILITRGLINCATSEDTLAAVIAHEVSHIQLEHGLKAIKSSRATQAAMDTLNSAAGAVTGVQLEQITQSFGVSVNEIVNTMVTNGYSQKQEYDADSMAMALLSLAGYRPSSLIDMLRVLEKEQPGRGGGFNKTHPTPARRITNANKTVGKYSDTNTSSYRTERFASVI